MIRRSAPVAFGRSSDLFDDDDVNPMENIANVSDVMLVLAVGIMLALVMHWNVNISDAVDLEETDMDASEIEQSDAADDSEGDQYEEVGRVYRDVETGEMYVVE